MLIVIVPIYVLLTLGVYRVILEAFMVIFRIYEETKKISERTQSQSLKQKNLHRPSSTAAVGLSTTHTPCMHGLTGARCPQSNSR